MLGIRFLTLYATIPLAPAHADESYHIQRAYYFSLLFDNKDFSNAAWNSFMSYDQPLVGDYIFGAALQWVDGTRIASPDGEILWHRQIIGMFRGRLIHKQSLANHRDAQALQRLIDYCDFLSTQLVRVRRTLPDARETTTCRRTVLIFGLLATLLVVAVGYSVSGNILVGLAAAVLFMDNYITSPGFQQVLTDSMWCCFSLACLVALLRLVAELGHRRRVLRIIALSFAVGTTLALAIGTKLIAGYMALTIVLAFGAFAIITRAGSGKRPPLTWWWLPAASFVLIVASASMLFIFLNPFLYHAPLEHALIMLRHRQYIMEIQSEVQLPAIHSAWQRTVALFRFGIVLGYPWNSWLEKLLIGFYLILLALGLHVLARRVMYEVCRHRVGAACIVSLWMVSAFSVIGTTVHMEWERYYLPLVICTVIVAALGIEGTIKGMFSKIRMPSSFRHRRHPWSSRDDSSFDA